jgi:hypothetical protein
MAMAATGRAHAHGELRQIHGAGQQPSPARSLTAAALRVAAAAATATSHVCAASHDNVQVPPQPDAARAGCRACFNPEPDLCLM